MNKFISLTKVLLKNGSDSITKGSRKKLSKTAFMWIVVIIAFIPSIALISKLISTTYDALAAIQQQGIILAMTMAVVCMTIFMFGIFYAINTFYFSTDIENLLPLPLKPSEILGAKFTVTTIYEYITEAIFLLPVLGVYGYKSGAGVLYYVYAVILFLILPVVPLTFAALIDMIIMSFTNVGRNKDRFKTIGGIIAMFIGLGISIGSQKLSNMSYSKEQIINMAASGNNSMVKVVSRIFPSSSFAANALINSSKLTGLINLLVFLAITVLIMIVFLAISEKLYFKGVVGISEAPSNRKKLSREELDRFAAKSSKLKSLTMRELKMLFRTPAYFLNCVIANYLWPLFILIPMLTNGNALKDISKAGMFVQNRDYIGVVLVCAFAFSIFLGASNGITSTAISREGQNIYISKYIPVSYRTQIMAKVMSGVIISLSGMLVAIVVGGILFRLPLYILLLIFVVSIPGILLTSFIGIFIDLNFPKLTWDNEQKAVKQNFNVMICVFGGMIAAGLMVFAAINFEISLSLALGVILIGFGIVDMLLYKLLCTKGAELFSRI